MKHTRILLLTLAAVLLLGTGSALALGYRHSATPACSYIDNNGDGLCDRCGAACHDVDCDGDGQCDRCSQSTPACTGTGRQHRSGHGQHCR